MKAYKKVYDRLYEIASSQQGYFTSKQAVAAGYADNTHPFHVKSGNWIREYRGIYRLVRYPQTERPDLVLWFLWSRNRNDEPQGVYSHQTALSIYELSDIMPPKLHMTVPPGFRRNSEIPKVLVLHRARLHENEIESMQGFRVTSCLRTISDLIVDGSVPSDILKQAVREALKRGLISRAGVQNSTLLSDTVRDRVSVIIRELSL